MGENRKSQIDHLRLNVKQFTEIQFLLHFKRRRKMGFTTIVVDRGRTEELHSAERDAMNSKRWRFFFLFHEFRFYFFFSSSINPESRICIICSLSLSIFFPVKLDVKMRERSVGDRPLPN